MIEFFTHSYCKNLPAEKPLKTLNEDSQPYTKFVFFLTRINSQLSAHSFLTPKNLNFNFASTPFNFANVKFLNNLFLHTYYVAL